jgi:xanthine dehydrogenase accessory factor
MEVFSTIVEYLERGNRGALATIVSRTGATPRDAGAKLFIGDDGRIHGTIGGGCVEAEVWQHAREAMTRGEAEIFHYCLNGKSVEDEGMICGGSLAILIEPVTGTQKELYRRILRCLREGQRALLLTKTGPVPPLKTLLTEGGEIEGPEPPADFQGGFEEFLRSKKPSFENGVLVEPLVPAPHVYIYGAGHISEYISKMAKMVDFHVTVIDDRAQFANRDRFPEADEVIVEEFPTVSERARPSQSGYAVIVTRGHKHDAIVLEKVLERAPRYVGMIGSRRKVAIVRDDLLKRGTDERLLRSVHAPIGIDIGGETPQEIAMSIVAELIKVRSGRYEESYTNR